MDEARREKLERAGLVIGTVADFLGLSDDAILLVEQEILINQTNGKHIQEPISASISETLPARPLTQEPA